MLWPLSGHSEPALRDQAARLADHLDAHPGASVADVGFSLATTRASLGVRAAVVGTGTAELTDALRAVAEDRPTTACVRAVAEPGRAARGRTVFVFPGQGTQWAGMAVELLDTAPAFAESLADCDRVLAPLTGFSALAVLRDEPGAPSMADSAVNQPVMWAVMVSLAALWRAHGVEPDAVVGHSQGELAAACVAGAMSLDEAARIVAARGRVASEVMRGVGGMVSVALPVDVVRERIERWAGRSCRSARSTGPRRSSCPARAKRSTS